MATIGNRFPECHRQEFTERNLTPGRILYLWCEFTTPPKDKYLVLACRGAPPLLFLISSRIHPFIASRPDLLNCQVELRASEYDFLSHDSFVDCSKVVYSFDEQAIKNQLLSDLRKIKGEINQTTKNEIVKAVRNSRTISLYRKQLIIDSLQESHTRESFQVASLSVKAFSSSVFPAPFVNL